MSSIGAVVVATLAGWLEDELIQPFLGLRPHVDPVVRLLDLGLLARPKIAQRAPPYWKSRVLRRHVLGDEDGSGDHDRRQAEPT